MWFIVGSTGKCHRLQSFSCVILYLLHYYNVVNLSLNYCTPFIFNLRSFDEFFSLSDFRLIMALINKVSLLMNGRLFNMDTKKMVEKSLCAFKE